MFLICWWKGREIRRSRKNLARKEKRKPAIRRESPIGNYGRRWRREFLGRGGGEWAGPHAKRTRDNRGTRIEGETRGSQSEHFPSGGARKRNTSDARGSEILCEGTGELVEVRLD